jgi:hypothetical protein
VLAVYSSSTSTSSSELIDPLPRSIIILSSSLSCSLLSLLPVTISAGADKQLIISNVA